MPGLGGLERWRWQRKLAAVERTVPPLWGKWSLGWVCSQDDANSITESCRLRGKATPALTVLPNIPRLVDGPDMTPPSGQKVLMSIGSLSFLANADGIDWFIRNVWPGVRAANPTALYR